MNLRKLGKDELDSIFKSLEMSDCDNSIILTYYFNEGLMMLNIIHLRKTSTRIICNQMS